ncbi:hypothetical protein FRB99_008666 [Tulasnella sp. 403]|nr:hypothetical protein FRB99_008666 [Tulasnella sp. 403]
MALPRRRSIHGSGRAVLQALGRDAVFSELSYTYPLKLVSPKIDAQNPVAIAYILSYGGGLISGDQIDITFEIGSGAVLQLLTQVNLRLSFVDESSDCILIAPKGSTKVFRIRGTAERDRASNAHLSDSAVGGTDISIQRLSVSVATNASLFLLPDPVTCFSGASYSQIQTFRLDQGATACILDWYNCGRLSRGEEWDLKRYRSVNEVWIGAKRVARDVMLLEDSSKDAILPLAPRNLKDRMAPYTCYATLLLFGPLVQKLISAIQDDLQTISQFQQSAPSPLIWSFSPIEQGGIVRVAGLETETVKTWLKKTLLPITEVVGSEAYDKAFV